MCVRLLAAYVSLRVRGGLRFAYRPTNHCRKIGQEVSVGQKVAQPRIETIAFFDTRYFDEFWNRVTPA
jgi:hypothetical protein